MANARNQYVLYTSESDPRGDVVTKQLQIKSRKNSEAPKGFEPEGIPTGFVLYHINITSI